MAADADQLFGPNYANTFLGSQGTYRASLPITNAEHDRPFWYGGNFKVTVTVGATITGNPHNAFETCCAYALRLRVWKRTTNGCTRIHRNDCEFSFTLIREDLIGNPAFPSCTELCPPNENNRIASAVTVK